MLVMKFGGSSLASGEALVRVASLVGERVSRRPVVVVSAIGRTTDALVAAVERAMGGQLQAARQVVGAIRDDLYKTVEDEDHDGHGGHEDDDVAPEGHLAHFLGEGFSTGFTLDEDLGQNEVEDGADEERQR